MSSFFLFGLLSGILFVLIYIGIVAKLKESPDLKQAIELIVSSLGAIGGIRICWNVLSGRVANIYHQSNASFSEEDMTYFLIGGFALLWISMETILRRFLLLHSKLRAHSPRQ